MIDKLNSVLSRYDELEELMSQPDAMKDINAFTKKRLLWNWSYSVSYNNYNIFDECSYKVRRR